MPRQYIVNSWVGAAEYDEGDTYNGEQIGHRAQKSVEVKMTRSGDQWKAQTKKQSTKKRSVREKIVPQEVRLKNLEAAMDELEQEYDNGQGRMTTKEYLELSNILEKKYKRAYELLEKAMGWEPDPSEQPSIPAEEVAAFVESEQKRLDDWGNEVKPTNKKSEKVLTDPSFWHTVFASLDSENVFRKIYFIFKG